MLSNDLQSSSLSDRSSSDRTLVGDQIATGSSGNSGSDKTESKCFEASFECQCKIRDNKTYKGHFKGQFVIFTDKQNCASIVIETDCREWNTNIVYVVAFKVRMPENNEYPEVSKRFERWVSADQQVTGHHQIWRGVDLLERLALQGAVEVQIEGCSSVMIWEMDYWDELLASYSHQIDFLANNDIDLRHVQGDAYFISRLIEFIYGQFHNFKNNRFVLKPPSLKLLETFREGGVKLDILDQMIEAMEGMVVEMDSAAEGLSTDDEEILRELGQIEYSDNDC